ncbi:MAG: outer membrane protein OmpU [Paracoccaceae bacterium]|jgi:outer membrane protein OmpU
MKKILLTTTVLAFSAGFAAAEVSISGSAFMGLNYQENRGGGAADEVQTDADVNINFSMSGETDGGLTFGAGTNHIVNDNGALANDDTSVYISGAFGKISMGAVGEAGELGGIGDFGNAGIDFDDTVEDLYADNHNVNYSASFGDLSFSASADVGNATDSFGIGATYNFGMVSAGIGYTSTAADMDELTLKVVGTFDAIKVTAIYADFELNDNQAYAVAVDYTMGDMTLSAGFADADFTPAGAVLADGSFGVGVKYNLGGGATVQGALGSVNDVVRAEIGVAMSF